MAGRAGRGCEHVPSTFFTVRPSLSVLHCPSFTVRPSLSVLLLAVPGITAEEMNSALWAREKTQNTAIGDGIALPHATLGAAERSYLGVFTTAEPIEHQAHDGKPVDVCFVTLGPPSDRQAHLRLLAGISRLIMRTSLLERLRAAVSKAEVIAAVQDSAAQLKLKTSGFAPIPIAVGSAPGG